jgi:hypothetical protein
MTAPHFIPSRLDNIEDEGSNLADINQKLQLAIENLLALTLSAMLMKPIQNSTISHASLFQEVTCPASLPLYRPNSQERC